MFDMPGVGVLEITEYHEYHRQVLLHLTTGKSFPTWSNSCSANKYFEPCLFSLKKTVHVFFIMLVLKVHTHTLSLSLSVRTTVLG